MSTLTQSQAPDNPFADPAIPTLAQVLDAVSSSPDLSKTERTARYSAIRTVGRALDLPLSAIVAHPKFLGKKLATVVPARVGLKKGSWANAKSILNRTLREQCIDLMPGRYLAPIAEDWQCLWQLLPVRPHRIALSRFIRYCSVKGIAPGSVTSQVFDTFDTALCEESLIRSPQIVGRDARRFWNKAANRIPEWPQLRVPVPDRRNRYQVPLLEFPANFRQELVAYEAASTGDVLDLASDMPPIKPISARNRINNLARLASAAVRSGVPASEIESLGILVRPETVRRGLRYIRDRNGKDKLKSFDTLLAHVITTARHWVKAPDDDLEQLAKLKRALNIDTYEMAEATSTVLRDLDGPSTLRALIRLPDRVFEETLRRRHLKRTDLIRLQVAVAIAILIAAPVRPKNLASLHLERHLLQVGAGRQRRRHLRIPGEEVKNGEDLEYPLPDRTMRLLEVYLSDIRPELAGPGNLYLFPGVGDRPKGAALLSKQVADLTEHFLGVRITAHKFRAVAGKIILDQNPAGQEIARQLLGHRDIRTTSTYYAPLQRDRAVSFYDEAIRAAEAGEHSR